MNERTFAIEVMEDAMADILRRKTAAERLRNADRIWRSARSLLRGAIRADHPDWKPERVVREIAHRISNGTIEFETFPDETFSNEGAVSKVHRAAGSRMMSPSDLEPIEFMQIVASFFESRGIAYYVVGSMASMAYGDARLTNDVDIVAHLSAESIPDLCREFSAPEYYVSEPAVRDAIARHFQFNIIHPASGLKVDVIVPQDTEFARSELARIRRISDEDRFSCWFGSPEDVILKKLEFFQIGGSEKHLRDIAGMIKLLRDKLDRDYLQTWADRLDVASEWKFVQTRVDQSPT